MSSMSLHELGNRALTWSEMVDDADDWSYILRKIFSSI